MKLVLTYTGMRQTSSRACCALPRAGVDWIIATDNGSADGSLAILQRYERQDDCS